MSKALQLTGGEEVAETAKFAGMRDKFFDCVNAQAKAIPEALLDGRGSQTEGMQTLSGSFALITAHFFPLVYCSDSPLLVLLL